MQFVYHGNHSATFMHTKRFHSMQSKSRFSYAYIEIPKCILLSIGGTAKEKRANTLNIRTDESHSVIRGIRATIVFRLFFNDLCVAQDRILVTSLAGISSPESGSACRLSRREAALATVSAWLRRRQASAPDAESLSPSSPSVSRSIGQSK
jgi:hypothetical protein